MANMPRFDQVYGVSTGALLATEAFLIGTPQMADSKVQTGLSRARKILVDPIPSDWKDSDIMGPPEFGMGLLGTAMYRTEYLERILEQIITPDVLWAVREESLGRKLIVGTTNLNTGQTIEWDLLAIVANLDRSNPSRDKDVCKQYVGVLLASAAAPLIFPPVSLTGPAGWFNLHADGAILDNLILPLDEILSPVDKSENPNSPPCFEIVCIRNGYAEYPVLKKPSRGASNLAHMIAVTTFENETRRLHELVTKKPPNARVWIVSIPTLKLGESDPVDGAFDFRSQSGRAALYLSGRKVGGDLAASLKSSLPKGDSSKGR